MRAASWIAPTYKGRRRIARLAAVIILSREFPSLSFKLDCFWGLPGLYVHFFSLCTAAKRRGAMPRRARHRRASAEEVALHLLRRS
jgi:hypothetical protein